MVERGGGGGLLLARAESRAGVAACSLGHTELARTSLLAAIAAARAAGGEAFDAAAVANAVGAGYAPASGMRAVAAGVVTAAEAALADLERAAVLGGEALGGGKAALADVFVDLLEWLRPGGGGGHGRVRHLHPKPKPLGPAVPTSVARTLRRRTGRPRRGRQVRLCLPFPLRKAI